MKRISKWILGLVVFSVCMISVFGVFAAKSNIKPEWYDSEMNLGYDNEDGYYYYLRVKNAFTGDCNYWKITDLSDELVNSIFDEYGRTVQD